MKPSAIPQRTTSQRWLLRCCGPALVLTALLAAGPLRAAGDVLAEARGFYSSFRYEEAYPAFQAALAERGRRPDEIADIYMHLGIIAASMDKGDEAVDHFIHLLCLQPEAELAGGLSPKVAEPFARAQQKAKGLQSFRLVHAPASALPAAGGLEVAAELQPDGLGMASGLTLQYRAAGQPSFVAIRREGTGPLFFSVSAAEIPPGVDAEYFLQITDQHGGVLWELGSKRAPLRVRSSAPPPPPDVQADADGADADAADGDEGSEPLLTQPWFLIAAGVTAAAVIAGGVAVVLVVALQPASEGASFEPIEQEIAGAR